MQATVPEPSWFPNGMIHANEEHYIAKVLNAAALTYVAATLQSIVTLAYYLMILSGNRR